MIGVQTSWFCEQSTVFRRRKEGKGREEGVRREREKCGCIGRGGEECGKEGERRVENHGGATKESYDQERIHTRSTSLFLKLLFCNSPSFSLRNLSKTGTLLKRERGGVSE